MKYILALDQGTTSSRAVLFDENGCTVSSHNVEYRQIFPRPGWVEHDPEDIWISQLEALHFTVDKANVNISDIAAVGITNQRETTLLWDRKTGKPCCNAIVWQCRRSAPYVEKLINDGCDELIRSKTGLVPDAYFSGTKLEWLLDNHSELREKAENGELCFGTVDSFLTFRLTLGKVHVTDATNACRTMLFDIHNQYWDKELLKLMNIPENLLPEVVDSSRFVGMMDKSILGREIPICAMAGDQHAALFGQACFTPGMAKNTYGTGCFVLMNTGSTPVKSKQGLVTTLAWRIDSKPVYALEGSVFVAGAAIKWLRDELHMINTAAETEGLALSVPDTAGVYCVPAFTGLGAPYWDMYARGTIVGLTRGAGRAHVTRSVLESIAFQSADVLTAMEADSGIKLSTLRADGGASANKFIMQFQSDILNVNVVCPRERETTALGVAMLAGRAAGLWTDAELGRVWQKDCEYFSSMNEEQRKVLLSGWHKAVERSRSWEEQ